MTPAEIKGLAHLARIEISDDEVASYAKDFESILNYVGQINDVDISEINLVPTQSNIARIDQNPHAPLQYHEAMLKDAPEAQDGFYKVPKIL